MCRACPAGIGIDSSMINRVIIANSIVIRSVIGISISICIDIDIVIDTVNNDTV